MPKLKGLMQKYMYTTRPIIKKAMHFDTPLMDVELDGWNFAEFYGPDRKANALLFAAAPWLYQACVLVLGGTDPISSIKRNALLKAIRKAKGAL